MINKLKTNAIKIATICLAVYNPIDYVNASSWSTVNNVVLSAEASNQNNSINLSWNVENPTQPFEFKIMRKRGDEAE